MTFVTIENLTVRIRELEGLGATSYNEDLQLEAFKMLLASLVQEPAIYMGVINQGRNMGYYRTKSAAVRDGADGIVPLFEGVQ